MTEGEKQAARLESDVRRIKKLAIPVALLAAAGMYYLVIPDLVYSTILFIFLLLSAADEYWKRYKIIKSPDKMSQLKSIESKRKASVYVNGGVIREFTWMIVIAVIFCVWLYAS